MLKLVLGLGDRLFWKSVGVPLNWTFAFCYSQHLKFEMCTAHYLNMLLFVGQLSQLHKMLLCIFVYCIQFFNFLFWAHTNSHAMHIPHAAILSWVHKVTGDEGFERQQTFLRPWRKSVLLSVIGWLQEGRNSKLPVDTNATFKVPLRKKFTIWLFQWQIAFLTSARAVSRSGTKVCLVHLSSVSP